MCQDVAPQNLDTTRYSSSIWGCYATDARSVPPRVTLTDGTEGWYRRRLIARLKPAEILAFLESRPDPLGDANLFKGLGGRPPQAVALLSRSALPRHSRRRAPPLDQCLENGHEHQSRPALGVPSTNVKPDRALPLARRVGLVPACVDRPGPRQQRSAAPATARKDGPCRTARPAGGRGRPT